jgi:trimethylamine-N-oxide reductase (cytochrome c)
MTDKKSYQDPLDVTTHTSCTTAGPMFVDVKDDRIIRVVPMEFKPEEVDSWEVRVNGYTYRPPLSVALLPWGQAYKRMQSDSRVGYPMKRVDWDPNGERNTQNRGISDYERISWDEAFDLIITEMRKVYETKGPSALGLAHSAHLEWGSLHFVFSDVFRFWHLIGSTYIEFTPNSWEGWACGTPFLWGDWQGHGLPAAPDSLQDISRNDDLIVLWGSDPILHNMYNGIDNARVWQYWKNLGKKIVLIEPYCNDTGVCFADKWIQIFPGTDGALAAAIAYIWITEGLYDQEFLDTHAVGFDNEHLPEGIPSGLAFKDYILGEGSYTASGPKTPEWAYEHCGVKPRIIRALARAWGSQPTSLWVLSGGICRRQFAHNTTRLLGTLQVMQGIGKPGVAINGSWLSLSGPYDAHNQIGPTGYADGGMNVVMDTYYPNRVPQKISFQKLYDCVTNAPQHWQGGHQDNFNVDMFFEEVDYPAKGCAPIEFIYQQGSTLTNPPRYRRHLEAIRSPQIKTFVVAAPWFDRDCRYADIVLPAATVFEMQDVSEPASVGQYIPPSYIGLRSAVYTQRCVEPYAESKSDLHIYAELAERMGVGEQYMEGNTEDTLLEKMFARTTIPMKFEDFKEKGYYVWPQPKDYRECKQFSEFAADPIAHPLDTPSGKFEIFSKQLYDKYDNNPEIPPIPVYTPEIEGHSNLSLREKYPLQMLMAHPKLRFHGKYNDCEWLRENYKVYGPDGYGYEPIWMNPLDAQARGLQDGDFVIAKNERGRVLAGVRITGRMTPGVAWFSYGAWQDPLGPEEDAIDRGGDANILSNNEPMSIHHVGGAFNSVLFEVEKADLDAIAAQHPEGWSGTYRTWK